ncbi:MAG: flagellar biosynthesis protein FlhF [Clostridia bacterium]|jgi:flagellar biosynthesis protein FlhF|nr:flagellar biosynthesis protein FlhF [Clostridia bacterium]MDD4145541.1 flagellar biosynthesis protein FlhF [Clostridia bacterium]MDD4664983.1 flagellar biosynthesis protein FlhF [Clostridia bacterium]
MRVKRFVAVDMQEAMEKIKSELGNDAVILHTRYFKEGGFLGFFRKNYVEVTAAADNNQENVALNEGTFAGQKIKKDSIKNDHEIASDLAEMHKMMQEMSLMLENLGEPQFPKMGQVLYHRLKKQEIEDKIAQKIVKLTLEQYSQASLQTKEELNKIFFANLLKPLQKIKYVPAKVKMGEPRILTFIGPTGVGKTTTIAKLAAMSAVLEKKKVALITVDTYRIAAVEQLKTIGDIMNVPVKVIFNPENLQESLREMRDFDVIYIDTAGRSHKNITQVNELKQYLESAHSDEIFLVLASTSKYQDFLDIFDTYRDINVTSLIFTKLDETSNYGSIYNLVCKEEYPISYFANGQNIPDDIEVADPIKLVQMLMKE